MAKRYVDADILEDLSHHARSTRDDLGELLKKCEARVKGAPQRGWSLGTWGDVFNSVKHEATSLDDDFRGLVDRAGRVREAAREKVLQALGEMWAAIAGLREKIEAEAGWLADFWKEHKWPLGKSCLPIPAMPGLTVVVTLALTWAWKEALHQLEEARKREEERQKQQRTEQEKKEQAKKEQAKKEQEEAKRRKQEEEARKREEARQQKISAFKNDYPDKELTSKMSGDEAAYAGTAGCVALVMCFASDVLGAPLGPYWTGGPNGAWAAFESYEEIKKKNPDLKPAFDPALWEKITWDKVEKPQIGDIVFFDWGGSFGHVAVITDVLADGRIEIMDQAYDENVRWKDGDPKTGVIEASTVDVRIVTPGQGDNSFMGVMRLRPPQ